MVGFVPRRCLHYGIFCLFASSNTLSLEFVFEFVFLRSFIFLIMRESFLSLEFSLSSKFIILCATAGKLTTDMKRFDGRSGHGDF